MLAIGTLDGLYLITGELASGKMGIRLHHTLAGVNIIDILRLPSEEILALSSKGHLFHRSITSSASWKKYAIQQLPGDDTPSTMALGFDGTLWLGTSPAHLYSTSLLGAVPFQWAHYPSLLEHTSAKTWWGAYHSEKSRISSILPDHELRRSCIITVAVGGIYITQDNGKTWTTQHNGITPLVPPDVEYIDAHRPIQFCFRNPHDHTRLYAGTGSALYTTVASGSDWEWRDITPPTMQGWLHAATPIVVSPQTSEELFCMAPSATANNELGVWKTADNGETWHNISHAPHIPNTANGSFAPRMLISHHAPASLFAISPNGDIYRIDPTSTRRLARNLGAITCAIWL